MLELVPDFVPDISPAPHSSGLDSAIREAADYAYATIGEQKHVNPEDVHRMGVCLDATALMLRSMTDDGYRVRRIVRNGRTTVHSYLEIEGANRDEDILIDATWQQFGAGDAPDVLVAPRKEFIETVRAHGIGGAVLELWAA